MHLFTAASFNIDAFKQNSNHAIYITVIWYVGAYTGSLICALNPIAWPATTINVNKL